ncbi:MAG TPA: LamG-like jellyroll fold domain-containing protein [Tepidisphaeraceae bacterium]|nr:LamG-like jellyroll fold domain-containing protein [Tepidisphaeraceae bacterium]
MNVLTYHNDLARDGANLQETTLTPANVNSSSFGKLFSDAVDGQIYTQPLYVSGLVMPDGKAHNVVFVATEHDSVYAFDADAPGAPLWKTSFINAAAGVTTVPATDVDTGDLTPEIGITGTPVINLANNTIYVVAATKEVKNGTTSYVQRLHALSLTTGAEALGGPVVITASATGTGSGTTNGKVGFNSLFNNQRTALSLVNGIIYFGFSSHGGNGVYHGWMLGYNATTLKQVFVYCDTPNSLDGGVWMGGDGLAADANGNLFFTSGDGPYDSNGDRGDSAVRFNANGTSVPSSTPSASWTPYNNNALWTLDKDLGSGGILLLPTQSGSVPDEEIIGGKEGTLYVLNRDNLGGLGVETSAAINNNVVQEIHSNGSDLGTPATGQYFDTPAYFNGAVFIAESEGTLKRYSLTNGKLTLASQSAYTASYPGGQVSVSANGNSNGIVWDLEFGTHEVLRAFDANDLTTELYDSNQSGARDQLGAGVKFSVPTIDNGHVYVSTSDSLTVFGQIPTNQTPPTPPSQLSAVAASPTEIKLAWTDNSINETSFTIDRSTDGVNFSYLDAAPAGATSYSDTSASTGTTYYYRVQAANYSVSSPSNIASATTTTIPNLVGYWPFDEGSGITTVDASGHGETGTLSGEVSWVAGRIGGSSVNLHGGGNADAHVAIANNANIDFTATQSFTLGAWVKVAKLANHTVAIISKSTDLGNGYGIYLNASNQWVFATAPGVNPLVGPAATVGYPFNPVLGWVYVAAVQDGTAGTRTLYINGKSVASGAAANASGAGDLWIGGNQVDPTQYFNGVVDDFRIYNRALSAGEIQTLATGALPVPWLDGDVGTGGFSPGTASYDAGAFDVYGSGADISGAADAFNYVYQTLNGDGQIVARVALQQNTAAAAKAGVMIRQSLAANSAFADMVITPGQGALFSDRAAAGGSAKFVHGDSTATAPIWLKLVRTGSLLSGYTSADGIKWTLVGSATVSMTGPVFIGLAVTSASTVSTGNAAFDGVTVSTAGAGTGVTGAYYNSPTFTDLALTRTDPTIDFNFAGASPAPTVNSTDFSVSWTGVIQPLYSETYTFDVTAADGVALTIDGQTLINDQNDHATATDDSASIALVGGQRYAIALDYFDHTDPASVKLEWSSPSQARQVVATAQLYPAPSMTMPTSLIGSVFNDANADGVQQSTEAAVSGIVVYLDENNNGIEDSGEPSATTNSSGVYTFSGIAAGAYAVRLASAGWKQTPAGATGISVSVIANQTNSAAAMPIAGVGSPNVSGSAKTSNGAAVAGEMIYLDTNNNGKLDNGELFTTTTATGAYSFSGVPAGATIVRQILPPGDKQTSPGSGYGIHITVSSGKSLANENFIDTIPTSTTGIVSGSVKLSNGAGVAGETIYLDTNNNSKLDNGELFTTTDSAGDYSFSNVPAMATIIRQILPSGDKQTTPGSGFGIHITIKAGGSLTNQNFADTTST